MFGSIKTASTSQATGPAGGLLFVDTTGTFTFEVPTGVTAISALAIGGGGGGGGTSGSATASAGGGGGGAFVYSNAIAVTPGETLTVQVGNRGSAGTGSTSSATSGGAGGESSLSRGGTVLLLAKGGSGGTRSISSTTVAGGAGGVTSTSVGDTKNTGGAGGAGNSNDRGGGGGGAAGYSGTGGAGGFGTTAATAGSGGGGGGGIYAWTGSALAPSGGPGGGTFYYGAGSNGAAGTASSTIQTRQGDVGSFLGGSDSFNGAKYGGGGGGASARGGNGDQGTQGGYGVVRLVWGDSVSFPSTNVDVSNLRLVASSASSSSTVTVPGNALPGDCLVLFDYADHGSVLPTTVVPSGFTSLQEFTNGSTFTKCIVSAKRVLLLTDAGSSLTGMNSTENQKILLVFRANGGANGGQAVGGNSEFDTTSAPSTQTVTDASRNSYEEGAPITFAFFKGSDGITPGTDITFSGAQFVSGTSNVYYVGYKTYTQSTTSISDAISMTDRGTNSLVSLAIGIGS